ncbi:hypothetical protein CSOJ01_15397 [Colletotrichum sojae]|uniref:Uncharacterized protein n=1 Tax=Colletotrichum sojae TaxID=2175907 RepID=A0A8H6IME7_9PEZI|nr:hypothetical protein CSOJ01_15397 [Colletotrichum sojae]
MDTRPASEGDAVVEPSKRLDKFISRSRTCSAAKLKAMFKSRLLDPPKTSNATIERYKNVEKTLSIVRAKYGIAVFYFCLAGLPVVLLGAQGSGLLDCLAEWDGLANIPPDFVARARAVDRECQREKEGRPQSTADIKDQGRRERTRRGYRAYSISNELVARTPGGHDPGWTQPDIGIRQPGTATDDDPPAQQVEEGDERDGPRQAAGLPAAGSASSAEPGHETWTAPQVTRHEDAAAEVSAGNLQSIAYVLKAEDAIRVLSEVGDSLKVQLTVPLSGAQTTPFISFSCPEKIVLQISQKSRPFAFSPC